MSFYIIMKKKLNITILRCFFTKLSYNISDLFVSFKKIWRTKGSGKVNFWSSRSLYKKRFFPMIWRSYYIRITLISDWLTVKLKKNPRPVTSCLVWFLTNSYFWFLIWTTISKIITIIKKRDYVQNMNWNSILIFYRVII